MPIERARLERWSRGHAICMFFGLASTAFDRSLVALALLAVCSFATFIATWRGQWTPSEKFGHANWVTVSRVALIVLAALAPSATGGAFYACVATIVLILDALDGWLARRQGLASAFGAHLDMETDALLVFFLTLELWLRFQFEAWILIAGLLRYGYVLWHAFLPPETPDAPRSLGGRIAFVGLAVGLLLAFVLPEPLNEVAAGVGTLLVCMSFVRSVIWSISHSTRPIALLER